MEKGRRKKLRKIRKRMIKKTFIKLMIGTLEKH